MPKGGKRPGAGRPKGTTGIIQQSTRDKAEMRAAIRRAYDAALPAMLEAQIACATGLKYLVMRNAKTGKFESVTKEMFERWLKDGNDEQLEKVEIWEKPPSVQAWTDLSNRVLDKPADPPASHEHSGTITIKHEL